MKDGRPLVSVTSSLFSQSQATQLACEKGVCCQGRVSVLAAESKEEHFGGSQSNTHFFEGMLLCSTKPVNLLLKALFFPPPSFFKEIFFSQGASRRDTGYSADGVHVPGFLIFHFYISVRERSC